MDTEIVIATSARVPVRLLDPTNFSGKTGITSPTVYLHKYGAVSTFSKTITSGVNWIEIDSVNMPGVYDLGLSSSDIDTLGLLKVSVKGTGTDYFIGTYNIVSATAYSIFNDLKLLRQMSINRTKVDSTANTFTLYDDSGTNPIITYDLYDDAHTASVSNIFERTPRPFALDGSITNVSSGACTLSSPTLLFSNITTSNHIVIISAVNPLNKGLFSITTVNSNSLIFTNANGAVDITGTILLSIV